MDAGCNIPDVGEIGVRHERKKVFWAYQKTDSQQDFAEVETEKARLLLVQPDLLVCSSP